MQISGFESDLISRNKQVARLGFLLVVLNFTTISFISISSCKSQKVVPDPLLAGQAPDTVLVAISRGPCFGRCPEYKAVVTKKGTAYYTGKRNVDKPGLWYATLPADQLLALITEIRNAEIESRDTLYINRYLADFPDCDLWVSDKLPVKHIHINHEAPPEELTAFSKYLDAILNKLAWEPVDPQPENFDR